MRRLLVILSLLCLPSITGCQVAANCVRDGFLGGLAEKFDTSRPSTERRSAYDNYVLRDFDR